MRHYKDTVTHWPVTANSFSGFSFGTPASQRARWEDRAVQFRTPEGEESTSASVVFLSEDVAIGDYVALGDFTEVADPTTLKGAFRVRQFSKVSNLRNITVERRAFL